MSTEVCPIKLHFTYIALTSWEIRRGAKNERDLFHFLNLQKKCLMNSFGAVFNTELRHIPETKPLRLKTSR